MLSGKGVSRIALGLFVVIYGGLTAAISLFYMDWSSFQSFVYFLCFEFLLIGIAHDISISIVALVAQPYRLSKLPRLTGFPKVALLITLCDDGYSEILDLLDTQDYPNYDVYLLDDSSHPDKWSVVDAYAGRYTILRRPTRAGFKAGNLNNWMDHFSSSYKYFAILDSDSKLPDDFLRRVVEYAEHPTNEKVAVFQSKIHMWNTHRFFARAVGALAPLNMFVMERTTNHYGSVLSYGHNILCRTDCVNCAGGFPEMITAEDTALTLILDAQGYSTKLVDIVSYDAEPEDVFCYARRTVRWAKQTVEAFRFPWAASSPFLKLTLCYNLYTYVRPLIYFILLIFTGWTSLTRNFAYSPDEVAEILVNNHLYLNPWFIVLVVTMGVWLLPILLQVLLAVRVRVSVFDVFLSGLLSMTLMHFVFIPMTFGIFRVILGMKVVFVPTNTSAASHVTLISIAKEMWILLILGGTVLLSIALQNQFKVFGINSFWVALIMFTPLILWLIQNHRGKVKS